MSDQHDISTIRKDYKVGKLMMSDLNSNPMDQFKQWLDDARATSMPEPTAMNLATCDAQGKLSSRMVLLKELDDTGFVFFTNYESHKANQLSEHAHAALCFWWGELERQVRIEGQVEKVSAEESNDYFNSRPRGSRIGAIASQQSRQLNSYQELSDKVSQLEEKYQGQDQIPRPDYWGGYRVVPQSIEFWQGRPSRLHDRLKFEKVPGVDGWEVVRLSP